LEVKALMMRLALAVRLGAPALLRIRHDTVPGEPDDFRVQNLKELVQLRSAATDTMTHLLRFE
jgi:hypothetical protein